jgi:Tc toxin complex TcA C-terminal TcB-binding domain/Neuraminidase-like domain/Salmonella virulence plasmid 28.1kDa A protein
VGGNMSERDDTYEISGMIKGRGGVPLKGARVVVWWQHIRERQELAATEANGEGHYELRYAAPERAPQPMLVLVEALSEHLDAPLFSPLTNAEATLVIDLAFEPSDTSEWAMLLRSIEPSLGKLKPAELVEDSAHQDLSFLARETGTSSEAIMRVTLAARQAETYSLPAPVFFAFLRQRIPSALPDPLLDASAGFTQIAALVQNTASQIFALTPDVQTHALNGAVSLDLIGTQFTAQIPDLVKQLQSHRAGDVLIRPFLGSSASLGQILALSGLPAAKQQVFAAAWAANTQPTADFLSTLADGKSGLSASDVSALTQTLAIGSFADNFPPLVQAVQQGFASRKYTSLQNLASLSAQDWLALVNQSGTPPASEPTAGAVSAQDYANEIYTRVVQAYPTSALSSRIVSASLVPKEQQPALVRFFQNNADLELTTDNIGAWLETQGDKALSGIDREQQATTLATVRAFQRVLRVAPDPDIAQGLLGLGIRSAMQIAVMGRQQFLQQTQAASLPDAEANRAFETASSRYAGSVGLFTQLNRGSLGVWPQGMGQTATLNDPTQRALQQQPALTALFGSQDYCETDDCTSVLSPAAYLCDLLLWLRKHPQGSKNALDVLDERRPDIRHLLLNCPNTDTELPYVDLVNELLADKISPPTAPYPKNNPRWKQTSPDLHAAQLSAAPEYLNQAAYVKLFGASYPQTLPYSTGLDGLRTYLQQWNLPLWQLRQELLPLSGATQAQRAAVAAERFGLSPHAQDLLVQANFVPLTVAWNTPHINDLVHVPNFLQAGTISYESLLELLQVSWVQHGLGTTIEGIDDSCTTTKQILKPLDDGFLDRAHRFLRLRLATGYKMWELDLLLQAPAVGGGALDEKTLIYLLAFRQLQDATGLAVDAQLAWFEDMDTASHRDPDGTTTTSLYAQVYLNPTVTWAAADPDLVNVSTGAPVTDPALNDHVKAIQPALAMSGADVAALVAVTDNQLTLANLSLIYRLDALAVASKFAVADLLSVAALLHPGAATPAGALAPLLASPAKTMEFLSNATSIQQAGLSLDALTYLSTSPSASGGWATTTQMTPDNIASALTAVQQAEASLLAANTTLAAPIGANDTTITVSSDVNFPAPSFYVYIGSEILFVSAVGGPGNTLWTVARGQQGTTAATAAGGAAVTPTSGDLDGAVIAAVAANAHTTSGAPLAVDVTAIVLQNLQVPGTGKTPLATLEDPVLVGPVPPWTTLTIGGAPATGDTLQTVLSDGIGAAVTVTYTLTVADSGSVATTAASFAAAIDASAAVTGAGAFLAPCGVSATTITLQTLVPSAPGSNVTSTNTALPGGLSHASISPAATVMSTLPVVTAAAFPEQYLALQLFDKVGVLVRGLRLVASDLSWLLVNAPVYGGLDLTTLPVTTSEPALGLSPLLTTLLAVKLARLWTAAPPASTVQSLYDVIAGVGDGTLASAAAAQQALQTITGWPLPDIEAFAAALNLAYPSAYAQPASYDALRVLESMSATVMAGGTGAAMPSTTLAAAIDAVQTSLTVASYIGFPAAPFYVAIGAEILQVTATSGGDNTTWTVTRGQQGSVAATAVLGATVTETLGAEIVSWATVPQDEIAAETLAASALGALKAQQASEDTWLALAPTLMNPIRDNRSAALQAWLMAQRDSTGALLYPDENALFDYFLIDVQMSSCMETSRVVQAYVAAQIFVERCLMNLEAPAVVIDLDKDDTWNEWQWMDRYRVWEANREVFLYPENWLIESERPNRTEIYQTFEQEVRQGASTADYLQTVVLNYIDRLDGLAHLRITGMCEDPDTKTIYVIARSLGDPPVFYLRTLASGAWSGWTTIPLDIKAWHAVPAFYRGRICIFWIDVKVTNEPQQKLPAVQPSAEPPSQVVERYVSIGVNFSMFRNDAWAPVQAAKGKLFDKPLLDAEAVNDARAIESLYTIKVQAPAVEPGFGSSLWIDVFRYGDYNARDIALTEQAEDAIAALASLESQQRGKDLALTRALIALFKAADAARVAAAMSPRAVQVGRAVFDGRFSDLELNNLSIAIYGQVKELLPYATSTYGPDAQTLLQLASPEPALVGEWGMLPCAGALEALPVAGAGANQSGLMLFTPASGLDIDLGPTLWTVPLPFRIVGPDTNLSFHPQSHFFFQDSRHSYWVQSDKWYWTGRTFSTKVPKNPERVPYEVRYTFHAFYHPFTRLFWNQLSGGDFSLLYDAQLQLAPDAVDPSYSDVFSFRNAYTPSSWVTWDLADATTTLTASINATQISLKVNDDIWIPKPDFYARVGSEVVRVTAAGGTDRRTWTVSRGQAGTTAAAAPTGARLTPLDRSQDRQFLDYSSSAAFSVYNWELFYHVPLYVAQMLSQNLQFEDALTWYRYIFDPTRQSRDPVPQRFWMPKPLHALSSTAILQQQINKLLEKVNAGDPDDVAEVEAWRQDPFNPFTLADMRKGVPYMKSTVMSYLDNLIAWGDNLFSTESREALSEATLLYVIASEILGPEPVAVTPPPHAAESFAQLEPKLDAFANAMVEIENVVGGSGGGGKGGGKGMPAPQTFYFTIPSNPQLLGYWDTVADRLYKLRHCQNIAGAPLQLALFDAPIDPGLLIAARAAGVDLSSVLSNIGASLPNYRFTALYPFALDFVNAVRAYGSSLQAALEKVDAGTLALLQQTTAQQLLVDGNQIQDWQVEVAQRSIDNLNQALLLAQQKYDFNNSQSFANAAEYTGTTLHAAASALKIISAVTTTIGAVAASVPNFTAGAAGFGGSPVATVNDGGAQAAKAAHMTGINLSTVADTIEIASGLANTIGSWQHRADNWAEAAKEAQIAIAQANIQLASAQLALQIAQKNQTLHQEQIDNAQKQIDFLTDKFTNDNLYDWMVASLSATYFQSYQLAYQLCKQVERCYQFELGIFDSSFIQFGYWDSLHKGLLSGETLNHDLRRMQASYLQQNARRYELSRYVSLGLLDPMALQQLLVAGKCDFSLPESLFDNDYPGHYNRRLTRVSLTVVYPSPSKFDNVKATLTQVTNKVRVKTTTSAGYPESPAGSDPRFVYNYAAVPQKIAMGNAQDDPGLFITTVTSNITDQRYVPFENAGAVSSWHLEMPQINNEVDLSTVGDIVIHLYYTALDGGGAFQQAVQADNLANLPTSGVKVFSAQNDFAAPWQTFLSTVAAPANQTLSLAMSAAKFPPWTRGKTISVTSLTVLTVGWGPGGFVLAPQVPLPTATVPVLPVAGASEPNICAATIALPANTPLGTWAFELQKQGAADFRSLTKNDIGDVLLMVNFAVT